MTSLILMLLGHKEVTLLKMASEGWVTIEKVDRIKNIGNTWPNLTIVISIDKRRYDQYCFELCHYY